MRCMNDSDRAGAFLGIYKDDAEKGKYQWSCPQQTRYDTLVAGRDGFHLGSEYLKAFGVISLVYLT